MKRALFALVVVSCAQRDPSPAMTKRPTARAPVAPVMSVEARGGLVTPDPACTCASPESAPAPTPYEGDCEAWLAVCVDVRYPHFLAREPRAASLGVLLSTEYVESRVYDAIVSFPERGAGIVTHDSTMRVAIGDIVPTPRGRARVVQVHRSFVETWDDGRVTLRMLEIHDETRALLFVSSGAPSHVGGVALTMTRAASGKATIALGERTVTVAKGDRLVTDAGSFPVVDVVDGVVGAERGWATIDTTE